MSLTKQPKGLYYLFFAEMWERYSFHGMKALLVLYMTAQVGGFGWTKAQALEFFSYYLAGSYGSAIIGGILADRVLGAWRATLLGGVLMALGHFLMSVKIPEVFYLATSLVCLGNGFFKPNISVMLGRLYEERDSRRDPGFSVFYMGLNIGAMMAGLLGGTFQQLWGFEAGFLAAALGMMIALLILISSRLHIVKTPIEPISKPEMSDEDSGLEKRRLFTASILCLGVCLFMVAFGQCGGLVNLFCHHWCDRTYGGYELPAAYFLSLNPIFGLMLAPLLSLFWQRAFSRNPFPAFKIAFGLSSSALAFLLLSLMTPWNIESAKPVSSLWMVIFYFLLTVGEMSILPTLWAALSWLSPGRLTGAMMALGLFCMGMGGYIGGQLGSLVDLWGPKILFIWIGCLCFVSSALMLWINPWLESLSQAHKPIYRNVGIEPR